MLLLLLLLMVSGCGPKRDVPAPKAAADSPAAAAKDASSAANNAPAAAKDEEKKEEEPQQKSLSATAQGVDLTLTDAKGVLIARVKAKAAAVGPSGEGGASAAVGVMTGGEATVYQEGEPAATLKADKMRADQAKRTVTGEGNVTARSLSRKDRPTIRADRMIWEHDKNEIRGRGNVVITRQPGLRVVGDTFVADTEMETFTIESADASASATQR